MTRSFARRVRRYLRDEKGTASLEFVMVAPLFFSFNIKSKKKKRKK